AGPEGPAVDSEPVIWWNSALVVTEDRAQTLGRRRLPGGRVLHARSALERLQLLAEVRLEARAVLTLEGAQGLDLTVELVALGLQSTEHLRATLRGLGVQHLCPLARLGLDTVGLALRLGLETLCLGASLADDAVC